MEDATCLGDLQALDHTYDDMVPNPDRHIAGVDVVSEISIPIVLHNEERQDLLLLIMGGCGSVKNVSFQGFYDKLVVEIPKDLHLSLEGDSAYMPMFVNFQSVELPVVTAQ